MIKEPINVGDFFQRRKTGSRYDLHVYRLVRVPRHNEFCILDISDDIGYWNCGTLDQMRAILRDGEFVKVKLKWVNK